MVKLSTKQNTLSLEIATILRAIVFTVLRRCRHLQRFFCSHLCNLRVRCLVIWYQTGIPRIFRAISAPSFHQEPRYPFWTRAWRMFRFTAASLRPLQWPRFVTQDVELTFDRRLKSHSDESCTSLFFVRANKGLDGSNGSCVDDLLRTGNFFFQKIFSKNYHKFETSGYET